MTIKVTVRPYRRRFHQPLQTAHGVWTERAGALLQLRDDRGRVVYGEIAPIPWFGSETLEAALEFCQALAGTLAADEGIPARLPATQFAIGSALRQLDPSPRPPRGGGSRHTHSCFEPESLEPDVICGLLPAGEAMLGGWPPRVALGHRTLKWKIGVFPVAHELAWLDQLVNDLPSHCRLRLDANGGLTASEAAHWLEHCDRVNANPQCCTIEHLEQPLPPDQWPDLVRLNQRHNTAIALDESVATLPQLRACHRQGWTGVYVVKPAIAGSPQQLQDFCRQCSPPQLVFSSVFETRVGRQAALAVAAACYQGRSPIPALGFGTQGQFDDDWDIWPPSHIWNQLR